MIRSLIQCPECPAVYTEHQCNIPFKPGQQFSIICECGYQFDVSVTARTILGMPFGKQFHVSVRDPNNYASI